MLFDKLSPTTDFISKIQLKLDILNKNILYITHTQDKILKLVKELTHDHDLQDTVDKYFESSADIHQTSPQTDTDEQ